MGDISSGELSGIAQRIAEQKTGAHIKDLKKLNESATKFTKRVVEGDDGVKLANKALSEVTKEGYFKAAVREGRLEAKFKPEMAALRKDADALLAEKYGDLNPGKVKNELMPAFAVKMQDIAMGKDAQYQLNEAKKGKITLKPEEAEKYKELRQKGIDAAGNERNFGKIERSLFSPDGKSDLWKDYQTAQAMATVAEQKLFTMMKASETVVASGTIAEKKKLAEETEQMAMVARGCQEQAMRKLMNLSRSVSRHEWGKDATEQMKTFMQTEQKQVVGERPKVEDASAEIKQEEVTELAYTLMDKYRIDRNDDNSVKWFYEMMGIKLAKNEAGDYTFKVLENSLAKAAIELSRMKDVPKTMFEQGMKKAEDEDGDYDYVLSAHEAIMLSLEQQVREQELEAQLLMGVSYVEARRRADEAVREGLNELAVKAKELTKKGLNFLLRQGVKAVKNISTHVVNLARKATSKVKTT